jgi:hypothetical protein
MAKGTGEVDSVTLEVLKSIREDLRELRRETTSGLNGVRAELSGFRAEVAARCEQVDAQFEQVDGEFNGLRGEIVAVISELNTDMRAGFHTLLAQGDRRYFDHEGRLRRLEQHVGLP